MALPITDGNAFSTTLGTDPVTITASSLATAGDLVVFAVQTYNTSVPQVKLHYNAGGISVVTEDETIASNATGTVVYSDGSASSVAYDWHFGDATNGFVYFWSAKILSLSGTPEAMVLSVTYGSTSTGSARRCAIQLVKPGSGDTVPLRASRTVAQYGSSPSGTGAGAYGSAKQSGTIPTTRSLFAMFAIHTGASSGTLTADYDDDGTFETTSSAGNGNGRTFLETNTGTAWANGYWDANDAHLPSSGTLSTTGPQFTFSANPTANKTLAGVVYATSSVATIGTVSLSSTASLSATGVRTSISGPLALSANATLATTGTVKVLGTLLLTGGGTLTASQQGVAVITGTAALSSTATLSAIGAPVRFGTLVLTGGGTLTTTGIRKTSGTMSLVGGGTLALAERTNVITYQAGGDWSSSSNLQFGGRTRTGTAALAATPTLTMVGTRLAPGHGAARLTANATLTATGIRTVIGVCTLTAVATLNMNPLDLGNSDRLTLDHVSRLTLARTATLTVDG